MPRDERIYKIQGVILRRKDLGEADRILTIFTKERGKIRVVAKGVKKPTSRKAGFVELFTHISAVIASGSSLDILSQVDAVESYARLRGDLEMTIIASHFCELVDAFASDEDENTPLFQLLVSSLGYLETTDDIRLITRYFELHLLRLAGFQPELFHCVSCGKAIEAVDNYFSVKDSGVVCLSCGFTVRGYKKLSLNALKVLRYFLRQPFEVVQHLDISAPVHRELEYLLHELITYTLERRLKSASFLRRLSREDR